MTYEKRRLWYVVASGTSYIILTEAGLQSRRMMEDVLGEQVVAAEFGPPYARRRAEAELARLAMISDIMTS